ncbi:hypothetical protein MPSI1_000886 [Malassezia psittaci]|uniref:Nuclear pore complex NUP2/50/61 domain-containing protein n=1 Tax=Malassezia psittaci TaxID=1821823 RepID=A0AAF0F7H1_9BASI|nr:hypothetical protein MPSI1_000886 [Malassezia psittaci]
MKRIADRQIQREDGEDPHAVDSDALDSQPQQDAAPQQRAIRGLPKRRAPGISSQAVAQPLANPFASIGSASTAKLDAEQQKSPAANPFANLSQKAPTAHQSLSVSASVPGFTFKTKEVQSQPESDSVLKKTEVHSTDRKTEKEKTDSLPLTPEKSRNDVEIYRNIRGLNWSFIRALINSFNQSSDCANFAPVLSAFEKQYTQHYNTIFQDQNQATASTLSKADVGNSSQKNSENKGDAVSLSSFGSSQPTFFSRPLTSTAVNAKAPSSDGIHPASATSHEKPKTVTESQKASDVPNIFKGQHDDEKKQQSHRPADSTKSPQTSLLGKNSFTCTAAFGDANYKSSGDTQAKQAGEDTAQKRLAALSSMRDRSGSKTSTSVTSETAESSKTSPSAAVEQKPEATTEADEQSTFPSEKEKESTSSASKPPTFSLSHGGFSFAGKSSSEILSSDQTVATSAPGAPTFSLPAGGFAFAGKSYSGDVKPPTTTKPISEANKSVEATSVLDNEHRADSTTSQAVDTVTRLESPGTPTIQPTKPITFGSASLSRSTESPSINKSPSSAGSNHSPHRFSFGSKPKEDATFTKAAFGPSFANTSGVTTGGQFSFGSTPISFGLKERSASPPNVASSPHHSE